MCELFYEEIDESLKYELDEQFNILPRINKTEDVNGAIFDTIINFELNQHIGSSDQFIRLIKEKLLIIDEKLKIQQEIFLEKIRDNSKYIYLHGYGKNGKSTFLELTSNFTAKDYTSIIINFDVSISGDSDHTNLLLEKCIALVEEFYYNKEVKFSKSIFLLKKIKNYISNNMLDSKKIEPRKFILNFYSWFDKLHDFIEVVEQKPNSREYFSNNYVREIRKIVFEEKVSSKELFSFIIISAILGSDNNKKKIIILDNIDDIYTNTAELLGSDIMPHVHRVLELIYKINDKEFENKFSLKEILNSTHFVFSLRTANYVSLITHLKTNGNSDFERKQHLQEAPVIVISTIKTSDEIIRKRINFYQNLSILFNFKKSYKSSHLSNLINSFSDKNQDFSFILKLWNGNRFAFYRSFKSINYKYSNTKKILDLSAGNPFTRAVLIYSTVKQLLYDESLEANTAFATSMIYFLQSHTNDSIQMRCNLMRLFLTQIKTNQNSKNIKTPNDIFRYGISLYDLLNKFSFLKDKKGNDLYNVDDFKSMFDKLFYENIDSWSHFVTCVEPKKTDSNDNKNEYIVRKYNFTKELEDWFSERRTSDKVVASLRHTNFYTNSNTIIFLNFFKRHFEYYNATNEYNYPPLYSDIKFEKTKELISLKININVNNQKFFTKRNTYFSISLFDRINKVFDMTSQSCLQTISFYKENFSNKFDPVLYCEKSGFAINNKFYFSDVIPKHINYLENIRQAIRDNFIEYEKPELMTHHDVTKVINFYFSYFIEKYLRLFFECNDVVDEILIKNKILFEESSNYSKTLHAMIILLQKVKILKNDYTNRKINIVRI